MEERLSVFEQFIVLAKEIPALPSTRHREA